MTTINPQEKIDLKILGPGYNWMRIGAMIAVGLNGYRSPLPEGSTISVHTGNPGYMLSEGPRLMQAGEYHLSIITPTWFGRMVRDGKGWYEGSPVDLRALAVFPHDDQMVFAIRKDLGIASFEELKERKYPLRLSIAPPGKDHIAGWIAELVLEYYGMSFDMIREWGGDVTHLDRNPARTEVLTHGYKDRVERMAEGDLDAIFDEAIMTKPWKEITDRYDFNFLDVGEDCMKYLEEKYSIMPNTLRKGRLRGVERDMQAIDMASWVLVSTADFPDDFAYYTVRGIDQYKHVIQGMFDETEGMTGTIDMSQAWKRPGVPLHSEAEKYYREKGYM